MKLFATKGVHDNMAQIEYRGLVIENDTENPGAFRVFDPNYIMVNIPILPDCFIFIDKMRDKMRDGCDNK